MSRTRPLSAVPGTISTLTKGSLALSLLVLVLLVLVIRPPGVG